MTETIVAAYDTPEHAELVVQDLIQCHVPATHIHRHSRHGDDMTAEVPVIVHKQGAGFWAGLFGFDVGDDHLAFDTTLEGGGTVVRVNLIPDQDYAAVLEILARHHPVDLDARGAEHGIVPADRTGPGDYSGARVRHYAPGRPGAVGDDVE